MRFLFPSDYFKPQRVDSAYIEQFDRLQASGFDTSVISLENLSLGAAKIYPQPHPDEKLIYRGWMISPDDYSLLVNAVRKTGADLWIDRDEYLRTHYLPNWYPLLQDLTPETYWFALDANLESELSKLGWSKFFIKDYVKSLKTSIGSIINDPSEISTIVAEMSKFRGTIEGGICVRKVEEFINETEQRYFVISIKNRLEENRVRFSYSLDYREIDISGTKIELLNLAEYFSRGEGLIDGEKEGNPYPYKAFAVCLEIKKITDNLVIFGISSDKIIVTGELQKLSIISENIVNLVTITGSGRHMHIEYFEDHPYLSEESIPIIIGCT